jgi:REP element-mobilizing transposase RayT
MSINNVLAEGHIHPCPNVPRQERTMPQSLTKLYAHLIFSTKHRQPFLDDEIRPRVDGYLATVVRDLGSSWVVVGGLADHVHILFDMGKMRAPVEFVEQTKRESSKFIKTLGAKYKGFYWQRGYGMFSVGPSSRDEVEAYVRSQEEHHRARSFQEEFRAFLDRYGITYDELYVWD